MEPHLKHLLLKGLEDPLKELEKTTDRELIFQSEEYFLDKNIYHSKL